MKNERQEKILAIIAASAIETQEQLIDSLRKEGISCTQATISRDIKQLHLIKEPTGNGTYRYAVSTQKMRLNLADRLQTILRESIVSVDCAQNLVLIKTMAGLGPAAGFFYSLSYQLVINMCFNKHSFTPPYKLI